PHQQARRYILARQRAVAVHAGSDGAREQADRDQQQPGKRPKRETQRPRARERDDAVDDENRAQRAQRNAGEQEQRGRRLIHRFTNFSVKRSLSPMAAYFARSWSFSR